MKTLSNVLKNLGVIGLAIVIMGDSRAAKPASVLSAPSLPFVSNGPGPAIGTAGDMRSLQSGNGPGRSSGLPHRFRQLDLTHGKNNPDAAGVTTVPHWSDSFTYNGLVYNYTMVGTDPKRGSATTVIPTVLIPIRFVFADGNVFDATTDNVRGQTPIQGLINSPLFQKYDFNNKAAIYIDGSPASLVKVGNTQYGDAFQRANFWDSVSTRSPNYHVLLGQPRVSPVVTVNVPAGSFDYYNDPVLGPLPLVDEQILSDLVGPALTTANVSAGTLPIMVWGQIGGLHGVGGFHGVVTGSGNALQTFIAGAYDPGNFVQFPNISGVFFGDSYVLSHEILEWLNDPFINNFTPGWDVPILAPPAARCDSTLIARDLLEVGDVVEFFLNSDIILPTPSHNYHVTEGAFVDYFTRSTRSRSYNGQYSFFEFGLYFFNYVTQPSAQCTGHVEYAPTFVDFPGATFTTVSGLNSNGTAVGYYSDAAGAQHGFVLSGSNYSSLNYPGSVQTIASKISDSGTIVGTFVDSSLGTHGFSYANGKWMQLDFPGSFDTEASGINAAGDIVGTYDGSQPITHAFVLRNGQYQRIDTPFGTQAEAFAINDLGSITGVGYTDLTFDSATAFVLTRNGFSPFQFPGSIFTQASSINNSNDVAGSFLDPNGNFWGLVTVSGIPYQVVNAAVLGNDNFDRICGYAFDFDAGRWRGFIGTLPLQRNAN